MKFGMGLVAFKRREEKREKKWKERFVKREEEKRGMRKERIGVFFCCGLNEICGGRGREISADHRNKERR